MEEAFIPNKIGRIVLMAIEGAIGTADLQIVLARAGLRHLATYPPDDLQRDFPAAYLSRLMAALEETYGIGKGRELALQSGRLCFRLALQGLSPLPDIVAPAFPFLPRRIRVKIALETLTEMFNRFADQATHLEEQNGHFTWVLERCGVCQGRTTTVPCCHFLVGLLQEALRWSAGQPPSSVTEVACTATGAPYCALTVEMSPAEG